MSHPCVVAIGLLLVAGCQTAATPAPAETITVATVLDGDTFTAVRADHSRVTIRLLGIDAPETSHDTTPAACGAPEATSALQQLLPPGSHVHLHTDPATAPIDRYGRILGYITTSRGVDVALALIEQGRAEAWYPAGQPEPGRYPHYRTATRTAQTSQVGSWATCTQIGR